MLELSNMPLTGARGNQWRDVDWNGRRVTLMGLGHHGGGLGAARYLARRGARVTISDCAQRSQLADSLYKLRGVPIVQCKFGGHDEEDFRTAEVVVVNPAVRPGHPCLEVARASGAQITSEIEIVLSHCRGRLIGVTGSNGKSTTCSMLAAILEASGRRTWLGGNIGGSLLDHLDAIGPGDWVVLELSSFQLAHLNSGARMPEVAVVTNCSANHLDWHGDFARYAQAKQRLLAEQTSDALTVLNADDARTAGWSGIAAGNVRESWPVEQVGRLAMPGEHNRQNAALAAAAAESVGVDKALIRQALRAFSGLPHRLQCVGELDGRRFWNDSKSTTPEATLAALSALEGPCWLLAGGVSKGVCFSAMVDAVARRARGACLFGAARDELQSSFKQRHPGFDCFATEHLEDALAWCWRRSQRGDVILLSPACASHDQYHDFSARGETFRQLVAALAGAPGAARQKSYAHQRAVLAKNERIC